ncbi:LysR family transcriptional regulator [Halalkalibacter okhensis]|uniref:LysR family transcriptional regulator n=1 Tax=Halalkalibacter okhensis TaxID=333138 RepID=A0A0B0I9P0_9BACI|nr:LysR family transcriptional regulator [Halalkalibacter okhensis]KHF37975.1 LysR family transcriptional regulator [Halalkalibacter okhensis]
MDIRQLEYFSEVAKNLSFTKASATLHVSQPSISKAIKNLEQELNVPLFYRTPKKLELTDAGKAVLVNAKLVLESFYNLTTELTDTMNLQNGEVRIGIPPIIGAAFFSRFITHFKATYPKINIVLTEVGTLKIKKGIEEGLLDIGFICNSTNQANDIEITKMLKDPLMLVVDRSHQLASKKAVHFSELKDEDFILYRNDFSLHEKIIQECFRHDFNPNIVCESSQRDFMLEMVEATLGIALLPSKICNEINNRKIVAIPLEQSNLNLELGIAWKRNKYLSFAVREFLSMSKQHKLLQ